MASPNAHAEEATMPRYYFHVLNGIVNAEDRDGVELSDISAATSRARSHLAELLADEIKGGGKEVHIVVMVHDDAGDRVVTLNSETRVVDTVNPFAS